MTPEEVFKYLKIAESKAGFEKYGYEEYLNGLVSINELAEAFLALHEQTRWRKWPEEKPRNYTKCLLHDGYDGGEYHDYDVYIYLRFKAKCQFIPLEGKHFEPSELESFYWKPITKPEM